jgi:hypothetical protein
VNEHPLILNSFPSLITPLIIDPFADEENELNDTFSNDPEPPDPIIISEILLILSLSLELNEISEIVNIPPEEHLNNGLSAFVP